MTEYKISARAYTKMILHAAKYPHCAVNGILLSSNAGKDKTVQIIDAVPLFHQCLHVSPMAEIALIQVGCPFSSYAMSIDLKNKISLSGGSNGQ